MISCETKIIFASNSSKPIASFFHFGSKRLVHCFEYSRVCELMIKSTKCIIAFMLIFL